MKFWTSIFGYSEIVLRLPSILFSLITGWMIFKIVEGLKGKNIGLWAAALFLFNPLIIYYSQEARMYSLLTMFITLVLYYLFKIITLRQCDLGKGFKFTAAVNVKHSFQNDNVNIIFCNLFIFLSFLTFYGSIFFIVSIYLYLLIKKELKLLFNLLPGLLLSFIIISPLLYQQFINSKIVIKEVLNWGLVLGKANIKNLLLIPIKFSIGRISFEPKILYWTISGLWTVFLFHLILKAMSNLRGWPKKSIRIFLWLFFVPLVEGFIASFFTPMLQYFRFIYLIPVMIILIVIGANRNWQKIIILSGFVVFSFIYLLNPIYHKEDWESLVSNLDNKKPVYMIQSSSDPIKYYNNKIEVRDLRNLQDYELENNIQIIPYSTEIHGIKISKNFK